ncbi:hypothetical protein [Salibacterium lacus]|uniref:Uncharacterized protein n=1 Tax=Salibacterium lacus TaxID=1898109 RepID=A0ABW5SYF2_9BACI
MSYVLQVKEPYIVKEAMLKNQTHQSFRWKDVAICDGKEELIAFAGHHYKDPREEWRIEERHW